MNQSRLPWVDTCKGLAIALVVFSHFSAAQAVNGYLYSFHMPIFFFLSGFLFNKEKYKSFSKFVYRRTRSILVPYFVFFLVTYLSYILLSRNFGSNPFMEFSLEAQKIYQPLIGIFYSVETQDFMHFNRPLWFLTCLFVTDNIFYLLQKISGTHFKLGLLLLLFSLVGYFGYSYLPFRPLWSMDTAFNAVAFYGMGFIARQSSVWFEKIYDWKKFIVASSALILSIIFHLLNGRINMARNVYGNYFYYYLGAFLGIILCIIISQRIGKNCVLEFLGKNSLIILCFHFFGSSISRAVVRFVLGIPVKETINSVPWGIYYTISSVLFILPIIFVINKYLPFIMGKSQKGSATKKVVHAPE